MFLNDLDPHFLKSVNCLYSSDTAKGDGTTLQNFLEEAIKSKTGVAKDLSGLVSYSLKQRRVGEFKPSFINSIEESKGSNSDNELELDLLKEDLMCIVCNGMDVGARNRLLECSDCHMLYHQECHKPIVTVQDSYDSWVCQNCKDAGKKLKLSSTSTGSSSSGSSGSSSHGKASTTSSSSSSSKPSSSHRNHSSSYKTGSSTSKSGGGGGSGGEKYSKTNTSSKTSTSSSSKPSASATTSRTNVTPNINIISADKRIQIMKKKAAKLQEKRKHVAIH